MWSKPNCSNDNVVGFQEDFHYEYTECDSEGGRWRVSVPKPDICEGGAPNPPVRGRECGKWSLKTI